MFDHYALLHTVRQGRGNRYGVVAGSFRFGYIPDRDEGRDFLVADLAKELDRVLADVGCSVRSLPKRAQEALQMAHGFTLVTGVAPKGYGDKIPVHHLVELLEEHPQMIRTLEVCNVYVVLNGRTIDEGKALALPEIGPIEGAEAPRIVPIPPLLKDPLSQEQVQTTNRGSLPTGTLVLRTSDVSMRWSKKGRHNIIFKARSGYIGYVPVLALDVQSPYRDRIYGECQLDALEAFKQNERGPLANSPLTRAVERFISVQVQAYAKEFEARDKRLYAQEERNAISKMNEALDRWKNRFLDELMRGLWGPGIGPPPPPPPLPTGKPAKLELNLTHTRAGVGVAFRPSLKFWDSSGKRIRPVPYQWVSEDTNIALVDEDLLIINTYAVGRTTIHAETIDGRVTSNKVPLEVIRIREIRIVPERLEMNAGSRQKFDAVCLLEGGEETIGVYLEWMESNSDVARVSSAGCAASAENGEFSR
jgi:hypothetical protein